MGRCHIVTESPPKVSDPEEVTHKDLGQDLGLDLGLSHVTSCRVTPGHPVTPF